MNHYSETQDRLYRARDGMIFGVCKGLARYSGVSSFWVRFFTVILFLFSGIWPMLGVYLIAAFIMKPEPVMPLRSPEEAEFYSSYVSSRTMALQRLKRTFDNLDRRIQRMENIVTARDYEWERRLNE